MFDTLPEAIKKEVIFYLEKNDFPAAKQLYNNWLSLQKSPKSQQGASYTLDCN